MANSESMSLAQLDAIIDLYNEADLMRDASGWVNTMAYAQITTAMMAAIIRIAGPHSIYAEHVLKHLEGMTSFQSKLSSLMGVIKALRSDIAAGFLESVKELIHSELFSDFLDMADFLLSEGYKDAAAVMGGGVLESHLHQLCIKYEVDLEITLSSGIKKIKKADQLNSELASKKAYDLLDQKGITAWLDLRNKAAHAKYEEYSADQVLLLLQSIRNFIVRCPA